MSGSDEYLKHVQSPHDHRPKMSSGVEIPTTTLLKVLALSHLLVLLIDSDDMESRHIAVMEMSNHTIHTHAS